MKYFQLILVGKGILLAYVDSGESKDEVYKKFVNKYGKFLDADGQIWIKEIKESI